MGGHLSHLESVRNPEIFNASCGPIRGNTYTVNDKKVDGYLGIPYAKPPIGNLKFKKPEACEQWTEPLDCYQYGPRCPPSGVFLEMTQYEKDNCDEANCLTLNIFAPSWESESGRPVMVYIHGGGFEIGCSSDYCDYSVAGTLPLKDVVVVTINYRLGYLGFLTTGGDDCKGNFGLWDQTLALKWIQKHIRSFGGDPENVTIFGQSAGGASVDFLSLSPHSRELFHKFIAMSGSALCSFPIRSAKAEIEVFKDYAKHFGYEGNDPNSLLKWYESKSVDEIANPSGYQMKESGMISFLPNIDGDFFPKSLDDLRKEAPKKPMMTGVSGSEGLLFAFLDPSVKSAKEALIKQIRTHVGDRDFENAAEKRENLYKFYTRDIDVDDEGQMNRRLVEFVGDFIFNSGVIDAARSATRYGHKVFIYSFEYCNPDGFGFINQAAPFVEATHCTDLRYILGEGLYSKFDPSEEELLVIDKMTTIFTNFAKYGDPNNLGSNDWEPYTLEKPGRHFRISYPDSGMRDSYHNGRCNYVEEIQEKNKIYENIVFGV